MPPIEAMTVTNLPAITPSITDAELVEAIRQKKPEAAHILYDRYSAAVYGMLIHVSAENATAVLQEVFAVAWKDINNYPSWRRSLLTWLLAIAMDLVQKKDEHAYLKAYSYYSRALYPHAYEILKSSKAAHELLQEIMVEVWETLALNNKNDPASFILFKGLKDRATFWLEDRERQKIVGIAPEVAVTHIAGVPVETLRTSLQNLVQALSPDVLEVITAVFIEAQTVDKVACDRAIKPSDVFKNIISACRLLSKFLDFEKP